MKVQSSQIFAQRVSRLMKQYSLTKKDMAQRLNMDYSTFWRKLNGQRNVDMVLLKKIAEILGTSTAYLTGETDIPILQLHTSKKLREPLNFAYWGEVANNARDIATSGDNDAIAYVSQMLKRALSLLNLSPQKSCTLPNDKTTVTNMPFIVGDNNENNLTLAN